MNFSVHWPASHDVPPAPGEIHLWRANLDEPPADATILSADEQDRARRFVREEHRRRFIAARSWLRQTLGAYLQIPPAQISFVVGERGKPALAEKSNPQQLRFNLSHSAQHALLAVARRHEVGVDIQDSRASGQWQEIARRWFTAQELEQASALPDTDQARVLTEIWTRKEAAGKALGEGLSSRVLALPVGPADWGTVDCGDGLRVWSLPMMENFAAAVAIQIAA